MKQIPLTKGKTALVNNKDFKELSKFKWCFNNGYASRRIGGDRNTTIIEYMHRRIVKPENGLEVDHINRNKLDNRRRNLRAVTRSVNMMNRDYEAIKLKRTKTLLSLAKSH